MNIFHEVKKGTWNGSVKIKATRYLKLKKELKEKPKIAFFLSHPIQYISPLLRELAKVFELHVYYFSDASITGAMDKGFGQNVKWDLPLLEGYNYTFIKNYSLRNSVSNKLLDLMNPGVVRYLTKENSGIVVVNGWSYFSDLLTMAVAKMLRKKVWLRAENPLSQEVKKSKMKVFLKKIFLKEFLFRFFVDKYLYIGKENKSFFEYYGAREDELIYTPYSVDNCFFTGQYEKYKEGIEEIKVSLDIPLDKVIVLFSGKYISKKRPLDLLRAFHELADASALLIMVGEGELRPQMESYINSKNLKNVVLTGFINQSSISKYYAIADIFVMCSGIGETWGLSVNEAMNFSKPVIVSSTCGCSSDLVRHGENGYVYPEADFHELNKYLRMTIADSGWRKKAGEISKEIIQQYSIAKVVKNLSDRAHAQTA